MSSVAVVIAVDVNVGASFTFATVTVKDCSTAALTPSLTVSVTACVPTSAFVGVPKRLAVPSPLSVIESQLGRVVARSVTGADSSSVVVMSYAYATSSVASVGAADVN